MSREGWKGEVVCACGPRTSTRSFAVCIQLRRRALMNAAKHSSISSVRRMRSRSSTRTMRQSLKSAVEYLGYRHQNLYRVHGLDEVPSWSVRSVRCWKGAGQNLVQSRFCRSGTGRSRLQHFAFAHNVQAISRQRADTMGAKVLRKLSWVPLVPFGCKVPLLEQQPAVWMIRPERRPPRACEGLFLGYHMQPGHKWKGEFLVCKLEAADYHLGQRKHHCAARAQG